MNLMHTANNKQSSSCSVRTRYFKSNNRLQPLTQNPFEIVGALVVKQAVNWKLVF